MCAFGRGSADLSVGRGSGRVNEIEGCEVTKVTKSSCQLSVASFSPRRPRRARRTERHKSNCGFRGERGLRLEMNTIDGTNPAPSTSLRAGSTPRCALRRTGHPAIQLMGKSKDPHKQRRLVWGTRQSRPAVVSCRWSVVGERQKTRAKARIFSRPVSPR